ncbi:MAG: hypothetical protein CR997_00045 [Acidobacteria bacterium]|nr:MAG: hypothetical protein CR997_00045 [Acidobacteriota bacterium]
MLQVCAILLCLSGQKAVQVGAFGASTFCWVNTQWTSVKESGFERDTAILMYCSCSEEVKPSQIVGISDHCMSLNLSGCERYGVVSSKTYFDHDRSLYIDKELDGIPVVLMGHAPVMVRGPVEIGDFIVPSGKNDGMGVGLPVANWSRMKTKPRVLGMARSSHPFHGVHLVDTALGFWDKSLIQFVNRSLAKQAHTEIRR